MKIVILLTACINPMGMPFTVIDNVNERYNQYMNALNFYLEKTKMPIVFCENSNTDISKSRKYKSNRKIEVLTFDGNYDKTHGKGYGEAKIIEYAINNSDFIDKGTCIIKITGRLIVNNINFLIDQLLLGVLPQSSIVCSFNSEFTAADSRIIIAPCDLYQLFLKNKDQINDKNGIFFEHVLSNTIKEQKKYCYFPFITEPQIIGVSGSTGIEYFIGNISFKSKLLYLQYRLQQQIKLTNTEHLKRLDPIRNMIVYSLYQLLRITNKIN